MEQAVEIAPTRGEEDAHPTNKEVELVRVAVAEDGAWDEKADVDVAADKDEDEDDNFHWSGTRESNPDNS